MKANILIASMLVVSCAASHHTAFGESPAESENVRRLPEADDMLTIIGPTEVSADRMWAFVAAVNPDFPPSIARAYYEIGRRYGIRGDVALCQSIIETGWFRFTGGTAVTSDQHNYCGLGVTRLGVKGHSFGNIEEGVTAQMQHLYAYASTRPLPKGEKIVDPRFSLVSRGVARSWTDLNRRWAANDRYGESILAIFRRLLADDPPTRAELNDSVQVLEIGIPDHFFPED